MTHQLYFNAEQVYLSFVKRALAHRSKEKQIMREMCTLSVLGCAGALEATVNSILVKDGRLPAFDELRLKSKIETIAHWAGTNVEWGVQPWQSISRVIAIRNWLSHYKEMELGLMNTAMKWVIDDNIKKPPRIDPLRELQYETIEVYYAAIRSGLRSLCQWSSMNEWEYSFLDSEEYCVFELG